MRRAPASYLCASTVDIPEFCAGGGGSTVVREIDHARSTHTRPPLAHHSRGRLIKSTTLRIGSPPPRLLCAGCSPSSASTSSSPSPSGCQTEGRAAAAYRGGTGAPRRAWQAAPAQWRSSTTTAALGRTRNCSGRGAAPSCQARRTRRMAPRRRPRRYAMCQRRAFARDRLRTMSASRRLVRRSCTRSRSSCTAARHSLSSVARHGGVVPGRV